MRMFVILPSIYRLNLYGEKTYFEFEWDKILPSIYRLNLYGEKTYFEWDKIKQSKFSKNYKIKWRL
jgi:hypothetical protein